MYNVLDNKIEYIENNEVLAFITFPNIESNIYDINHTFVDPSLRGKGIARKLVEKAVDQISKKNGRVVASCSYAKKVLEKY